MPKSQLMALPRQAYIDITTLVPNPENYNVHPKDQIDRLVASLERFGQVKPIVVQYQHSQAVVVAGHGLLQAFQQLAKHNLGKWGQVWSTIVPDDWDDNMILGYLVADNETARGSEHDNELLADIIERQQKAGYTLASIGYTKQMYDDLLSLLSAPDLSSLGTPSEDATKGELLSLINITIDDPLYQVQAGDVLTLQHGDRQHTIVCATPFFDWPSWIPVFLRQAKKDANLIFLPFAGPFAVLGEVADQKNVFLVQPDPYICGHCVDRFQETHPDATIKKVQTVTTFAPTTYAEEEDGVTL